MTKVLHKRPIAHDPHCYVFQDGDRGNRWYLYFYDQERQSRHRHSLGRIAPNDVLEAERKERNTSSSKPKANGVNRSEP